MDKSHRRPRYSCLTGQSSVPWVTGARGKPGDPEHKAAASCLVCGQLLQRKQTGRAPKYCGAKCRDRAREGRTFAVFGVARRRGTALDAPLGVPGMAG
jgi:hypothetical protein